eukprot:scaffold132156_cov66-Phaeocystis_antarctica.AAC.3
MVLSSRLTARLSGLSHAQLHEIAVARCEASLASPQAQVGRTSTRRGNAMQRLRTVPSSRLAARLFELSHAQLVEIAVAGCKASPEVTNQAEAILAANNPLAQRFVDGVLLSSDLAPHVLAPPEDEEEKQCRLCWGGEDEGPLVQPCACRGSAKWIHKACLEEWRRTSPKEDAAHRCGQCMDEYRDALSLELLRARLQAKRMNGQNTHSAMSRLAEELLGQGKYDEAEPLCREALAGQRQTLGDRHPDTLSAINQLGRLMDAKGDLTAAELLYREALEGRRAKLGNRHDATFWTINNLCMVMHKKGDLTGAELLYRETLDMARETLGNQHKNTLNFICNLGSLMYAKGNLADAEKLCREALEGQRKTLGNRHPKTLISVNNLGSILQEKGDLAAAETLYREAVEGQRKKLGDRHPHTLTCIGNLGALLQMKDDAASKRLAAFLAEFNLI